jgi:hypothetical protein
MMASMGSARAKVLAAVVAVLLPGTGCGSAALPTPAGPAQGEIVGRVTASPACPVERPGQPCPPRGVVVRIRARAGGRTVASTRSASDGSYRLRLAAGSYTLVAAGSGLLPRCPTEQVVVSARRTTKRDIVCDSGLR